MARYTGKKYYKLIEGKGFESIDQIGKIEDLKLKDKKGVYLDFGDSDTDGKDTLVSGVNMLENKIGDLSSLSDRFSEDERKTIVAAVNSLMDYHTSRVGEVLTWPLYTTKQTGLYDLYTGNERLRYIASKVPETCLACDGSKVVADDYPELAALNILATEEDKGIKYIILPDVDFSIIVVKS